MRAISASSMSRARLCAASLALPVVNATSEAAEKGVAVHAFVAHALQYGRSVALANVPEPHRAVCEAVDLDAIRDLVAGAELKVEVAFELHPETLTARIVGENIGRSYEVRPGCVYGTADLVAVWPGESPRVLVLDFKTGQKVEDAGRNWQLLTLACAASWVFNLDEVQAGLVYLRDGQCFTDLATLGAFDLDAAATELATVVRRVAEARKAMEAGHSPDVYPSADACKWCPSFAACPAKTALVREVAPTVASLRGRIEVLTADEKGAAWVWLEDAEKALKVIRGALEAQAAVEPFPTPDGRTVQVTESTRRFVNGERAWAVLVAEFGRDAVEAAFERSTSATALKRAFNGEHKKVMQLLEDAGAMDCKTTTKVQAG